MVECTSVDKDHIDECYLLFLYLVYLVSCDAAGLDTPALYIHNMQK
jgi:hypothetical protein